MTRVLMATHGWGVLQNTSGDAQDGKQATFTNPADGTPAIHWDAGTGGTSASGPVTADARGRLMRWIEEGVYNQTVDGETLEVYAVVSGSSSRTIDYLPTLALQSLADRDGIDLFSSEGVWAQWLTDSWAEASAAGRALLLPPGVILMKGQNYPIGGALRPPLQNPQLIGAGRGRSIIRAHPSLLGSSPIISYPVEGASAELNDLVLSDLTFDGNFFDNTAFNTRCTLTSAYTYGDATITCAGGIPAGFPASQAHPAGGQFDDAPQPDVQYFNYTSRDSTHFYGCTPDGAGKRDQPIGMEIFWRDRSGLGLVRFYAAQRMAFVRVDVCNGPGYGFGLEARPDTGDIETDLYLEDCRFFNNGSDGVDLKWITRYVMIRCQSFDNADTGYDPRSQYGTMINCQSFRNAAGIDISASRPILPEIWADLFTTCTNVSTSITLTPRVQLTDIPVSGSGHLDAEEIDWTGRTDNGNGTLTITGVTRGLRGTRAVAHLATGLLPRLVPDLSELTVPKLSEVESTALDFEWITDLIGCQCNDNLGAGLVLSSGGQQCTVRVNVFGGGAKGNAGPGLALYGSNRGRLYATIHGGQYLNAGSDNIYADRVHELSFFGTYSYGATGNNGNGDGFLLEKCSNGVTMSGVISKANAGKSVRLIGNTDYCALDGEAVANVQGDVVAESAGYSHNRGNMFGSGRLMQGLVRVLLPVSDAGSASSTLPTIWGNLPDRRDITTNTIAACATQRLELWPVWLPKGLPITRMGVLIGGTGSASITNSFFALYDDLYALLVQTPDGTGGAQAAADYYSRPLTASATYTVPQDALYWFGIVVKATTCPTYAGRPTIATGTVPWARIITSNTGLTGTAPSTATPASEGAGTPYLYFK